MGVGVGHPRATTSLTQIGVLGSWVQPKGATDKFKRGHYFDGLWKVQACGYLNDERQSVVVVIRRCTCFPAYPRRSDHIPARSARTLLAGS
jgi:hypothetical protein